MRPRLTRPIAEINSPRRVQEARPRVLCALRNVRRQPGAEPCQRKPRGLLERPSSRARQSRAVSTATSTETTGSYSSFSHRADPPREYITTIVLLYHRPCHMTAKSERQPRQPHPVEVAGNSPVYSHGCKSPLPVAEWVAGKPSCKPPGRKPYFRYSSQGCRWMTLYGYARVSVREPEDKNLDLQVERLVRAGCSMGNIRAEEASGAKDDRGGLLELLDLVVEGDTLVVTHIDRLSRGLTYGLQVIEGLHHAGVEFRSLVEDFDTSTANGKLQLSMVLAFSEWWRNSIRDRSVAGQAKARAEGRFPGRRPSLTEQQREYIQVERSKGVSQRELAKQMEVSRWTIQQVNR